MGAGAARAKFDQFAFSALNFGLCPNRSAAGRTSPRHTGDNGAALFTALRQGLAALTGAIARALPIPAAVEPVLTDVGHHAEPEMVAGMIEDQK